MASVTGAHPLLDDIERHIAEREQAPRRDLIIAFARALLRRTARDRLQELDLQELARQVVDLYDFADERRETVAVRVIDSPPDGTAVEVNVGDAPFLVDTVREAINAQGSTIRLLLHPVIGVRRAPDGSIAAIENARGAPARESVMRIELHQKLDEAASAELAAGVRRALDDLQVVVSDFASMLGTVTRMIDSARSVTGGAFGEDEVDEAVAFLEWLRANHFVLLGSRDYEVTGQTSPLLRAIPGTGLGILRDEQRLEDEEPCQGLASRVLSGDLITIGKTVELATVHRRARMDDISLKKLAPDGSVIGQIRLVGLFTSLAYMEQAARTPLLRRKLRRIVQAEELIDGSHDYKAAAAIFESFPRDELFQASSEELRSAVMAVLAAEEARRVSLTVRLDPAGHTVTAVIALPRESFTAELRKRLQRLLTERFGGASVDYHLSMGEGELAQLFFTISAGEGGIPEVQYERLEAEIVAACRSWEDELRDLLRRRHGDTAAQRLASMYGRRLPAYYRTAHQPELALLDIEQLEAVRLGAPFSVGLQNERPEHTQEGARPLTRVVLAKAGGSVPLGQFLPVLENLGLTVIEEIPTRLEGPEEDGAFLHDFGVLVEGEQVDIASQGSLLADAITAVWSGAAESDSLGRLIARGGMGWRDVAILRAYRRYRQLVSPTFTESYQNDVLVDHSDTSRLVVELFRARFADGDAPAQASLLGEIRRRLDAVGSLDEDRILRAFLELVQATVRTNAYSGGGEDHLSFKLRSADVPGMPRPYPLYEIFVYSTQMEGIHLRGGPIARGGIRWSDRREDYRTEILGLMKAQMVKNAVIVPEGSKGGFVLRNVPADRDELKAEVTRRYSTLIEGLLDITDNVVGGEVVHPEGVAIYDGEDPYLVVAADKGTAALSDVANDIAVERGFWLGDAFASGGRTGYDHKALGITARGAWESVKRHFRELGHDVMSQPFTVVGVGDMSGDVFGNGMLLSEQIELVAAFDHRHIFIDPNPDPATSFAERKRLFELGAGTSWADYDASLISAGGGVYPRSVKSIELSPEVRMALGVDAERLTPPELAQAVLRAPVDLFWNGGIGTFVKASSESNADVGDRTNDAIRIDGRALRARVVGEGGNLGLTQAGRVEYAMAGGRLNTDAIDNSAGVDCSDHEVNIKILLGLALEQGTLAPEQRDALLASLADAVCELVLYDNYLQVQILSQEESTAAENAEAHEELMRELEAEGMLDRTIEYLPSSDSMAERHRAGRGLTRPELAVLLAYAKRSLRAKVLASTLPDEPYLDRLLRGYFPPALIEATGDAYTGHRLRREIIATMVTNDVINSLGITWVARCAAETGAAPAEVTRAYYIAREVSDAWKRWDEVEKLFGDPGIPTSLQMTLMDGVDWLVEAIARWYLQHAPVERLEETIERDEPSFSEFSASLRLLGSPEWRAERALRREALVAQGIPFDVAEAAAWHHELTYAPDVIAAARTTGRPLAEAAHCFFLLGERLHLDWLESRLDDIDESTKWQRWAVGALADDLHGVRRELTERVLAAAAGEPVEVAIEQFIEERGTSIERLERLVEALRTEGVSDVAAATVAVRQLRSALFS